MSGQVDEPEEIEFIVKAQGKKSFNRARLLFDCLSDFCLLAGLRVVVDASGGVVDHVDWLVGLSAKRGGGCWIQRVLVSTFINCSHAVA